jgi:adenine-specific DNA methylase
MKRITEVGADKIRGGFYTPPELVDATLARLGALLNGERSVRLLEPSSGDGAFVRGIHRLRATRGRLEPDITCVEVMESEAALCEQELARLRLDGTVVRDSFFSWANQEQRPFDAFVGNPPFIRYQFVPPEDRSLAAFLMRSKGYELQGVSNYWIPFVVLGLEFLRVGGAFALVLPAEIFSTVSGGQVRGYVVRHFESLRVDLYPRDTFPDILQDVLVVSGVRAAKAKASRPVTFSETIRGKTREWNHAIPDTGESWKRYLLTRPEWEAFDVGKALPGFAPLKDLATIGVAIVTGANDFFTVDDATLAAYELERWAQPLLARTSDSPGIVFETSDHAVARRVGNKAWMLDFAEDKPDPMSFQLPRKYLELGESQSSTRDTSAASARRGIASRASCPARS